MQNPEQHDVATPSVEHVSKSKVIRDTFVFQLKLFADGVRDIFLSPVSMIAALAGIIFHPTKPDLYLRKLMYFGRKTDRWINLFGTLGHHPDSRHTTSDAYVKKMEETVIKDYQEGGMAKVVKNGTVKLVEKAQNEVEAAQSAMKKSPKE